jgi:hypothetical protein
MGKETEREGGKRAGGGFCQVWDTSGANKLPHYDDC